MFLHYDAISAEVLTNLNHSLECIYGLEFSFEVKFFLNVNVSAMMILAKISVNPMIC